MAERPSDKTWAKRWLPAIVGLGAAGVVLTLHANHFDFVNDDAFISFRYADNLVRHGELTYNPGERVEGYTNFLWTMVIAGVLALGGDPVWWSKQLGVVLSLGTLAMLFAFALRWSRSTAVPRHPAWAALAPLLLAMSAPYACWTQGGLETSLFTLLTTAAVLLYLDEERRSSATSWVGLVLALAAMTRPEGLMVAAVVLVHSAMWAFVRARVLSDWRRHATRLAGLVGVYLPYWLWRYSYYGFPLPNTYYAKGENPLWEPGFAYVSSFVADTYVWLLLPLLAISWWGARRELALVSVVGMLALPWAVHVARVGGDFMALYRFLVPLLPLLYLVGQESVAHVWLRVRSRANPWRAAVVLVLMLSLFGWVNAQKTSEALEVGSVDGVDSIGWLKQFVEQTTAIGLHLQKTAAPDTSIATTAAGTIPYYSRLRTLDLLGLNDVYTAHNVPGTGRRPGHAKSAPEDYVLRWAPDRLIWHPRMSERRPHASASERRYWRQRGYQFAYAEVENLEPPYWAWFERVE